MKCLSLIQPWATLVILGVKRNDTRSWRTRYRGRVFIHASRQFPERFRALCSVEPYRSVLRQGAFYHSADLPTGALIGTVELVDCLPADEAADCLADVGHCRPEHWKWQLDRPIALPQPIPYRGRLGLFDAPEIDVDATEGETAILR